MERISVWAHASKVFVVAAFAAALQAALSPPTTQQLPPDSPAAPQLQAAAASPAGMSPRSPHIHSRSFPASHGPSKVCSPPLLCESNV